MDLKSDDGHLSFCGNGLGYDESSSYLFLNSPSWKGEDQLDTLDETRDNFPPGSKVETSFSRSEVLRSLFRSHSHRPETQGGAAGEIPDLEQLTMRQIEEEIRGSFSQAAEPKVRFLKISKKKPVNCVSESIGIRKKSLEKRFSSRFHKDSRLLNKMRRVKLFWTKESQIIPNVFRVTVPFDHSDNCLVEFQDFSWKEVLPDEVEPESHCF